MNSELKYNALIASYSTMPRIRLFKFKFTTTVESQNKIVPARFIVVKNADIPLLSYETACELGVLKIANSITESAEVKRKFLKCLKDSVK